MADIPLPRGLRLVPLDPTPAELADRAERIAAAMPRAFPGWLTHVRATVPAWADRTDEDLRHAFTVDDARRLLAAEHGAADVAALNETIEALAAGSMSHPLRDLVGVLRADDPEAATELVGRHPNVVEASGTFGRGALWLATFAATARLALPPVPSDRAALAVVDALVAAGADVRGADLQGWTPLHVAGFCGNLALIDRLLDAGASVSSGSRGESGGTPANLALFYAHREAGARLVDAMDRAPDLRAAAALDRVDAVEAWFDEDDLLAGARADDDFCRPIPAFPLRPSMVTDRSYVDESLAWASRNGAVSAMAALAAHGADVNANAYRGTPLLWAVFSDAVESAEWLLDHGADPDLRHDFGGHGHGVGAVAMHLAAQFESLDCLRLLLDRGADPTIRDAANDGTPYDWAVHTEAPRSAALLAR